jgi:hypothetical protein
MSFPIARILGRFIARHLIMSIIVAVTADITSLVAWI